MQTVGPQEQPEQPGCSSRKESHEGASITSFSEEPAWRAGRQAQGQDLRHQQAEPEDEGPPKVTAAPGSGPPRIPPVAGTRDLPHHAGVHPLRRRPTRRSSRRKARSDGPLLVSSCHDRPVLWWRFWSSRWQVSQSSTCSGTTHLGLGCFRANRRPGPHTVEQELHREKWLENL